MERKLELWLELRPLELEVLEPRLVELEVQQELEPEQKLEPWLELHPLELEVWRELDLLLEPQLVELRG